MDAGTPVEEAYAWAVARPLPPDTPGANGAPGEAVYACPYRGCGKLFGKRFNLKAHCRKHSGDKPFVCAFKNCGRRFMWKSSVTSHEAGHARRSDGKDGAVGKARRAEDARRAQDALRAQEMRRQEGAIGRGGYWPPMHAPPPQPQPVQQQQQQQQQQQPQQQQQQQQQMQQQQMQHGPAPGSMQPRHGQGEDVREEMRRRQAQHEMPPPRVRVQPSAPMAASFDAINQSHAYQLQQQQHEQQEQKLQLQKELDQQQHHKMQQLQQKHHKQQQEQKMQHLKHLQMHQMHRDQPSPRLHHTQPLSQPLSQPPKLNQLAPPPQPPALPPAPVHHSSQWQPRLRQIKAEPLPVDPKDRPHLTGPPAFWGAADRWSTDPQPLQQHRQSGSGTSTSPHAGSAASSLGSPGIVNSPVPPPAEPPVNSSVPRRPRPIRTARPLDPHRQGPASLPPLPNVLPAAPPAHIDLRAFIVGEEGEDGAESAGPLPPMTAGNSAGPDLSPMTTFSPGAFGVSNMPYSPLQPFSAGIKGEHVMQDSPSAATGSANLTKGRCFW